MILQEQYCTSPRTIVTPMTSALHFVDGVTKVLLLSAGFGDGHRQAAIALKESFSRRGVSVLEVDCFQETNRVWARMNQRIYEWTTRHFPAIYGASYRWTANISTDHFLWKLLSLSTRKALVKSIRAFRPDIVLQLFPDHASESVKRLKGIPYLGVVITDFSVHSHWFHKCVDTYFIANGQLRDSMKPFVTEACEIVDSGIPVRNQFRTVHDTPRTISNRPYVLLATGGRGLFPQVHQVITTISKGLPNFDVYVLCGRNTDMLRRIEQRSITEPRVHGLSYVENVAAWFQNASFAVIKAGGITVSECLAAHCPMIFYRPQPGQEADNATFLERMGAGVVVHNPKELTEVVENQSFTQHLLRMKQSCAGLARPDAADMIVDYVLNRVGHPG